MFKKRKVLRLITLFGYKFGGWKVFDRRLGAQTVFIRCALLNAQRRSFHSMFLVGFVIIDSECTLCRQNIMVSIKNWLIQCRPAFAFATQYNVYNTRVGSSARQNERDSFYAPIYSYFN